MLEIELKGAPRERGRAHGESAKQLIAEALDRWFEYLAPSMEPDEFISRLTAETGFYATARDYAADYLEEVRGIAEGAEQPFETLFAWQLVDEGWWFLDEVLGRLQPLERCSALAINDGQRGIVAQTEDLDRYFDGAQVMLRYRDLDGLEVLAPSVAGLLAFNGVNSAGVAVAITTISQVAHSRNGLSSGFILPMLIRCRTVEEGIALLKNLPIASGNTFGLGSRHRSVFVEVSSAGIAVLEGPCSLHTNHPLELEPRYRYGRFLGSVARLEELESNISSTSTVQQIESMFSGGEICRSRASSDAFMTVATMIFELSERPVCHFAPGPLDSDQLVTYHFSGA